MTVPLLEPGRDELVEAIAQRVAELLADRAVTPAPEFVDAVTLARMFGISRSTVYERQRNFGAVALPPLPGHTQPLVRFDLAKARAAWTACDADERSEPASSPEPAADPDVTRRAPRRRRYPPAAHGGPDLLPIKGEAA
jgi:hypothetical protein